MITKPELVSSIESTLCTKVALVDFSRRLADALTKALTSEGVSFHAVNEDQICTVDADSMACKLVFKQPLYGPLTWNVSGGLGVEPEDGSQISPQCITTLSDSELARCAAAWAALIARTSRHLVFRNLYIPKSVEMTDGYNDLRVAFRFVRAYDVIYARYIVRFDCVFKNLAA